MSIAIRWALLACCCAGTVAWSSVYAAPPWNRLVPFKRVQADPEKSYAISEDNGPWMIMATTFSGEGAREQAQQLVFELRKTYKLPAYTYQKRFDYSKPVNGRGIDRYGAPLTMKYQRDRDVVEIAVLVGDYQSVDDPAAQKVLKKIKVMTPETLKVERGKPTSQSLAALRTIQGMLNEKNRKKGPMGHAFVTRNPLLPDEYFVPKGLDKLVLQMNKGVKHSLLDCPGKYTVRVATFTGAVIIDQKIIQAAEAGGTFKSRLEEAADKAHRLTEALRAKGVEAYEFHDRYMSMVTIGHFDSVGTPRPDGKIEINPAIHTIMKTYGADSKTIPGQAAAQVGKPKSLAGISFDVQPVAVEVPRRSISSDYTQASMLR